MKLEGLTVWQRQMLVIAVGRTRGTIAVLRKADKALDVLEFSNDEASEIGLVSLPKGNYRWNPATQNLYDLEIKDKEAANHVKRMFKAFEDWPMERKEEIFDLEEKLGLAPKQDEGENEDDGSNPEDDA